MVTLANEAAVSQASTSACCSPSAGGRSARTAGVPSKSAGKNSPMPNFVRRGAGGVQPTAMNAEYAGPRTAVPACPS